MICTLVHNCSKNTKVRVCDAYPKPWNFEIYSKDAKIGLAKKDNLMLLNWWWIQGFWYQFECSTCRWSDSFWFCTIIRYSKAAARAAKITLHSVDLVQFSTSRAYTSLKGPHPQRTSAVLHRSSTLTVAAALMPMHLLDGHCPFVDFAFFYTILSTINIWVWETSCARRVFNVSNQVPLHLRSE